MPCLVWKTFINSRDRRKMWHVIIAVNKNAHHMEEKKDAIIMIVNISHPLVLFCSNTCE